MNPHVAQAPFVGVNADLEPTMIAPGEGVEALNLDFDRGTIRVRPGFETRSTFGGQITGIHDYRKHDGTAMKLVMAAGGLYAMDEWTPSLLETGYSQTRPVSFATVNNRVYFCEGTKFKVTDGVDVYDAPIPRPDALTPTVADGGAGDLTGEFDYKYTYYSTTWGQESAASNASGRITVAARQINVANWDITSLDARVDKIRLYRRRVDAGEVAWRLIDEYSVPATAATAITDDLIDEDVSVLFAAPPSYTETIPKMDFLAYQNGVLYMVSRSQPTRIYHTVAGRPWLLANYFTLEGSATEGEKITGIAAFQSVVAVFTENSLTLLSGNSTSTHAALRTQSQIGCRGHHSIVARENLLYFLSEEGFAIWDGAQSRIISDSIRPTMIARDYSLDYQCLGIHDYERNAIYWVFSYPDAGTNSKLMAHFYRNSMRAEKQSWSDWTFASAVRAMGYTSDPDTTKRMVTFGFYSGTLGTIEGNDDGGSDIEWAWRSGRIDFGEPGRNKAFTELELWANQGGEGSVLVVEVAYDGEDLEVVEILDQVDETQRLRLADWGREIELRLSGTQSVDYEITGYMIEAALRGRTL